MDPLEKATLKKTWTYILENVYDVAPVLDHLMSTDVVTWDMKDKIFTGDTRKKRMQNLLDLLPNRGASAFEEFCSALSSCGYEFVVDELNRVKAEIAASTDPKEFLTLPIQESPGTGMYI